MADQTLTDILFDHFGLQPQLQQGLNEAGFTRCTPIQAMTLPLTLAGKDVAGQAQTGTGKTAAFLVALYQRLLTSPGHGARRTQDPRAVVLAPTRELALQIEKDALQIGRFTELRLALIYGGVDYEKQRRLLTDGVDIIVATPGRLIDFVKQNVVSLRAVEVMVLDEADRMFDLGFIKDIRFLLRRMPGPSERQNLLFSATLSHRVLELAYEHMNDPEKIVVEADTVTAANVRQVVYLPATEEKMPLLLGLLAQKDPQRTIVFVNTKFGCERVAVTLERAGYKVGVLSGDVPQRKRESLLARFVKGELTILVATDVAARGLHIPAVTHVFNYDLPLDPEDYVHRIGRTARLGAEGDAISFACDEYAMSLPEIEAYIAQKIPVERFDAALLLPLPRGRAAGAGDERSVVEDAFSEAQEARRRRRERDSGARGGGSRAHAGHGSRQRRAEREAGAARRDEERRRRPGPEPEVGGASAAPPADAARGKRRRRGGRGRRGGERQKAVELPLPERGGAAREVGAPQDGRPRLRVRIKQAVKSWIRRLGMPRTQR